MNKNLHLTHYRAVIIHLCEIFMPTLNIIYSFWSTPFVNDFFSHSLPHQKVSTMSDKNGAEDE